MKKQVLLLAIVASVLSSALSFAEYDPNQFDSQNAAHWYRRAFAIYQELNSLDALRDYATGEADLTPDLEKYLQSQEQVVKLVNRAAGLEKCDWQYDRFKNIWESINNYAKKTVNCGILILADVRYAEPNLLPMQTCEKFQTALAVAEHIKHPNSWDSMNHLLLKGCCYSAIQAYLNRCPDLSPDDLSQLEKLLLNDSRKKEITLNDILDDRLEFARVALTQHTDQCPREQDDPICRIVALRGQDGWKDFYANSLAFYLKRINKLRSAVNTPLTRSSRIKQIEAEFSKETDAFFVKYSSLPDDFVPKRQDYDQLMEECGILFAAVNDMPLRLVDPVIMKYYTRRNALITAIDVLKHYHRTGALPSQVPANSPKDRFGNQAFELIKSEDGFVLKSRSQNVYEGDYPEYNFMLPAK